jgi:hypothetical protein
MDTRTRLDVPASPTLPRDLEKYVTVSMLKPNETVLSVWQVLFSAHISPPRFLKRATCDCLRMQT